jgi:peptidoglycan/xylan/chitin deacetylase (PgdA/CDA1 family)
VDVATEIQACGDVLKKITGRQPDAFRPPGGDYDQQVAEVAEARGYTMILWTDDPGDYAQPGAAVIEVRTVRAVNPGGIILLHDGVQQTVDVLPQIIDLVKKKGLGFVTVDEMLAASRGSHG